MLDIKRIRQNPEEVAKAVARRGKPTNMDALLKQDADRRALLAEAEALKARRNAVSKEIPKMKKNGEDVEPLFAEMKQVGDQIKALDDQIAALDDAIRETLLSIPNTPNPDIPDGLSDADNVEVKRYLEPTHFDYEPMAHWDIGEKLGILDFETAARVTGARFTFYKGLGARLDGGGPGALPAFGSAACQYPRQGQGQHPGQGCQGPQGPPASAASFPILLHARLLFAPAAYPGAFSPALSVFPGPGRAASAALFPPGAFFPFCL